MPTIRQRDIAWQARMMGFHDDDRIGRGGFEAPSGRQWWEPERRTHRPTEFTGEGIGYFLLDPDTGEMRLILDFMLTDITEADDQDWQDFNRINRKTP